MEQKEKTIDEFVYSLDKGAPITLLGKPLEKKINTSKIKLYDITYPNGLRLSISLKRNSLEEPFVIKVTEYYTNVSGSYIKGREMNVESFKSIVQFALDLEKRDAKSTDVVFTNSMHDQYRAGNAQYRSMHGTRRSGEFERW